MKSPFDVAKEIVGKKRSWDEHIEKAWNTYMINRVLSMDPNNIEIVDHIQRYFNIPVPNVYITYCQFLYQDRYHPYVKSQSSISKDLKLIEGHFKLGKREARDYLSIISDETLRCLRDEDPDNVFTLTKIKKGEPGRNKPKDKGVQRKG